VSLSVKCFAGALALSLNLHAADGPRYGAADFMLTPQQPIGFQADGSGQGGEGRLTDRKAMVRFKLINLADPKTPKTVSERNLLQEPGPAADIHVERFFAGLDPFLFAGTCRGSASFFGCVMGGPVASGNRVFIQSAAHLRCIGDPAVKYDWNPASRPAHITNALKFKETPK